MSQVSPNWLKDFLYDRPIYAFAALLIIALIWVTIQWRKAERARVDDMKLVYPLAAKMTELNEEMLKFFERLTTRRPKQQTQT